MSYRDWLEEPCEPEYKCMGCDDKQEILDEAKEFLEGIVEQIYSRNEIDIDILDHCIEYLCYKMNVRPANGKPQVMRRRNPIYLLQDIIDQESEFLKTISR